VAIEVTLSDLHLKLLVIDTSYFKLQVISNGIIVGLQLCGS